jgi:hypothetical protein
LSDVAVVPLGTVALLATTIDPTPAPPRVIGDVVVAVAKLVPAANVKARLPPVAVIALPYWSTAWIVNV